MINIQIKYFPHRDYLTIQKKCAIDIQQRSSLMIVDFEK